MNFGYPTCMACGRVQPTEMRERCYDCGKRSMGRASRSGDVEYMTPEQATGKPSDAYVPALLALIDALVASGVPVKGVRVGALLLRECATKVGARIEPGTAHFERSGLRWIYDENCGAFGVAII